MTEQLYEPILQFFAFSHLRDDLQGTSKAFHDLAVLMFDELPYNAERGVCLRKLLEAKDAAVRARIAV